MKVNRWLFHRVCLGLGFVVLVLHLANTCYWYSKYGFLCDIKMRVNEVSCAHTGVNPFRVWNQDVESETFVPLARPDKPNAPTLRKGRTVHAYPPWHNTFFWGYGWIPDYYARPLFFGINVLAVVAMLLFFEMKLRRIETRFCCWLAGFSLFSLLYPMLFCLFVGNYGILLAVLSIVLYCSLSRGKDILAGIVWALMMIKPQVGLLFFWPLFFGRKFMVIATAVTICLLATAVQSCVCREHIIDLILQVPEIGRPYVAGRGLWVRFAEFVIGKSHGVAALAVAGFLVCGLLSYYVRNARSWWMRAIPVSMIFPVWTFCQETDYLVTWNLVLFCAMMYSCIDTLDLPKVVRSLMMYGLGIYLLTFAFDSLWGTFTICNVLKPTGIGWLYQGVVTFPRFVYWIFVYGCACVLLHKGWVMTTLCGKTNDGRL